MHKSVILRNNNNGPNIPQSGEVCQLAAPDLHGQTEQLAPDSRRLKFTWTLHRTFGLDNQVSIFFPLDTIQYNLFGWCGSEVPVPRGDPSGQWVSTYPHSVLGRKSLTTPYSVLSLTSYTFKYRRLQNTIKHKNTR